MKRCANVILLAVAVLMTVAAVPAGAAPAERPFKADATIVSASAIDPGPLCGVPTEGFVAEQDVYEGIGTHLGRFDLSETLCLDFGDFDPPAQPIVPFEVFGTFVAANGDELTYHVAGVFNALTGEVTDGGFVFTGGTGRFESAGGSGAAELERDAAGNIAGVHFSGVITYDASDRSR